MNPALETQQEEPAPPVPKPRRPPLLDLEGCVIEASDWRPHFETLPSFPAPEEALTAGANEDSPREQSASPRRQKKANFTRQINVDIFQEGIRRFLQGYLNTAAYRKCEEYFEKSALKKLILPFEYQAASRLA